MPCVCLLVKFKGKPDAGNPLVRFDEGEGEPSLLYQGWYSAEELLDYIAQNIPGAHAKLRDEPMEYLGLRDYQIKAVERVEAALADGQTKFLVAMATGTGKTRLAISLIYRLIKTGRFRRILFVVDRKALGEQAGDKFKETRLEELKTFDQIYDIKEVDKIEIESTTKVNIATVQGLMRAIMNPSEKRTTPSVGQYDCIIVDEAHRGYTLDRELGEDELPYRDQSDYLSKYRRVIDYFDAVKIGLTATPAPHTIDIFGHPVYTYTYREAVVDGWLIDHEPPHQLHTHLSKEGIKWEKGDTINSRMEFVMLYWCYQKKHFACSVSTGYGINNIALFIVAWDTRYAHSADLNILMLLKHHVRT